MSEAQKTPNPERVLVMALAKALWKQAQKATDPAADPKALSARWLALRKTRDTAHKEAVTRSRTLVKAISKAGYRLDKLPEGSASPAKKNAAKTDGAARKAARVRG